MKSCEVHYLLSLLHYHITFHLLYTETVKFLMSQRRPTKEEREALHSAETPRKLDDVMSRLVRVASGMLAVVVVPEEMKGDSVVVGTNRLLYIKPSAGNLSSYMRFRSLNNKNSIHITKRMLSYYVSSLSLLISSTCFQIWRLYPQ